MSHKVCIKCMIIGDNEALDDFMVGSCDMIDIGHGFTQPALDFDRIVPQPDIIRHAPSGDTGVLADRVRRGDWSLLRDPMFDDGPSDSVESFLTWLKGAEPGLTALAERSREAFEQTGHGTRDSWRLAHWGSTGNAQEFHVMSRNDRLLAVSFTTADHFPEPILRALAERHPELEFHGAGEHQTLHCDPDAYEVFGSPAAAQTQEPVAPTTAPMASVTPLRAP